MFLSVLLIILFAFLGFIYAPLLFIEMLFDQLYKFGPYVFPAIVIVYSLIAVNLVFDKGIKKVWPTLVVMGVLLIGLAFYNIPREVLTFDKEDVGYVEVDSYYDILDRTYSDREKIDGFIKFFSSYKVRMVFDINRPVTDEYTIKFYDKDGKLLQTVTYCDRERTKRGFFTYMPVDLKDDNYRPETLEYLVEHDAEIEVKEAIRDEVNRVIQEARYENGKITIEIPTLPHDRAHIAKIYGSRTVSDSKKKEATITFYQEAAYLKKNAPGNYLVIDFKEKLKGEKLFDCKIEIWIYDMKITFDANELIPDELLEK